MKLLSGKEALIALANGEEVEYNYGGLWLSVKGEQILITALTGDKFEFRLKPKTINLNGVDVGLLESTAWGNGRPKIVELEFKSEDEAYHFHKNAINIFNGVK